MDKNKHKILQCKNCDLVFLEKRNKHLEDNKIFRKIFDGSNSLANIIHLINPGKN